MEKPLVSIITLVYNINPIYVKKALKSMLNQTYKNIEIIVMDDASTKYDYSFISLLSNKIYYYKNEINLGLGKNLNKGYNLARGKYIVRLDSDDLFNNSLIEKEVTVFENDISIEGVCCDLCKFGLQNTYIARPEKWNLYEIINGKYSGTGYGGGFMFKKTALCYASTDESINICEDFDFQLQILKHGKIKSINEPLYYYRSHKNSIAHSASTKYRKECFNKVMDKYKKYKSSN